jgi:guanine deaminase
MHQQFIDQAVQLAAENVAYNGKPFGAVIVKDGQVIATGVNDVLQNNDPTAHAEMQAIRLAAQKGNEMFLQGATMYASGHPCPMCLAAMYLTGFEKVYYHTSLDEVEDTPLDVKPVYWQLQKPFAEQAIALIKMETTVPQNPVHDWLQQQKGK